MNTSDIFNILLNFYIYNHVYYILNYIHVQKILLYKTIYNYEQYYTEIIVLLFFISFFKCFSFSN